MDDGELRRRAWRGMVAFQQLIGRHAPGPPPLERDQFVASSVPTIPASLINAAVPLEGARLGPHLDEIADYYAVNPKWGAWIDPAHRDDVEALTRHGLVLDSRPVLMAALLGAIHPPAEDIDVERASMADVGAVNDVAYENPESLIADAIGVCPTDDVHPYASRAGGEIASVAMVVDVDEDAFVTMVATLPQHRGHHLASNLLRHALQEAKERNLTTTSLQASHLGRGIYARLGYRPLGEVHLYETRSA
jgi:ribosomal protein S18 acetylase RimI-like enzyme